MFILIAAILPAWVARAQESPGVSMGQLAMPESMIYFLLRGRSADPTNDRAELERKLQHFRSYAHDRRRQADGRWLTPLEYERRREAFNAVCREATNHFRQAKGKREPTHRERLSQSRHQAAGQTKLRQAAGTWAEPLLRTFLLGVAALQEDDFGRAENLFAQCIKEEPRVAAFYQGRAQALMGLKRYSEALRTYMQVVALMPDSREAVGMLRQALKDAPGSNIETPAFREAREMLQAYPDDTKSSQRTDKMTTWLLPGKTLREKENSLPNLPMDRLVVQQAVGTPLAEHTLLVDERILRDADEVLVQIDPKTFAPATVSKSARRKSDTIPMTLITVQDYTFTPRIPLYGDPKPCDPLMVHAINTYAEMGGVIREQPVKVLTNQDGYITDPSPSLADGESAGIILTDKGELAGVVVRDLNVTKDSPAETIYVTHDLNPLLKRIPKTSSRNRMKRTVMPKKAPGRVFAVYAIQGERFRE